MTQPTISDLSATASSNTDFNGVGILGTNLLSTADDAQRSLGAMLAGYSKDLAGIGQTVGGTANAITLTVAQPWTALASGLMLAFKNTGGPNTTAVTLAVTNSVAASLGTKAIRLQGDSALAGGEMVANGIYLLRYDAAYNSAAGAWVLLNPAAIKKAASSTSGAIPTWSGTTGDTLNTGGLTAPSGTIIGTTDTQTLTNKRVTPRITAIASNAAPTINTDNCDFVDITALAAAVTSMTTNLSGTPTNGQKLIIRFKDNGTARAITWGASFEAAGVALPTTTVISKRLTVGFIYDTTTSKWGCVASLQEA